MIDAALPAESRTRRVIGTVSAVVLAAMVILPIAQALARRFGTDIPGAGIYVQHLTLWTGFLGAVLAAIDGRHLSLSTVNLIPAGLPRRIAQLGSGAITAAVNVMLVWAAIRMVQDNRGQTSTFGAGIPVWWSEAIMPVTLAVIAFRSIWRGPGGAATASGSSASAPPPASHVWTARAVSFVAAAAACALPLAGSHASQLVWPGALALAFGFLLGTPVYVTMAGLAMLLYFGDGTSIASVPNDAFGLVTKSTLPAVPLLTLGGFVLAAGGASQRLVAAYRALFGWVPGGMALMALGVCALFTALTGASGVTILAVGGVILPSLREEGYPEGFSLGLVTAAGSLGLLFPPSLPVILYGVVAEADIKSLYLAGLVPGVLIIVVVALYAIVIGIKVKAPRHKFQNPLGALWQAKWDLGMPIAVGVPLLSGHANIVEAAALGALYAIVVEVAVFRNLHWKRDLARVMGSAAGLVGAVVILMGIALALTQYLALQEVPNKLLAWVAGDPDTGALGHIHTRWGFLLALNVLLLVLGSVLEMYSAIVVLAPLIVPLGKAFHVDPIHLGVVFLANLELGFLLPPMGLNLFLSATRFQKPLPSIYRAALPFLILMSIGVLLVTYLDPVTTGVLKLFGISVAQAP